VGGAMINQPQHSRRNLLGILATLPVLARTGKPWAAPAHAAGSPAPVALAPFPEGVRLLVAGPDAGALNGWADAVLPALEQSLPPDTSIHRLVVGGADGVTGANRFEARGVPDGLTVLLVPGLAVLAWMVGDPRAQFDVGHWVPVMAGVTPGLVAGRPAIAARDGRMRIAAAGGVAGLDLPALLGCDLLGIRPEPVFGLTEPAAVHSAFAQGAVDAVFLRGHGVPERLAALSSAGAQPLFSLGAFDDAGRMMRDPALPDVPNLAELYTTRFARQPSGPLYSAWSAAAAATQLEFALVLPQLTAAAMVSLWRRAGTEATAANAVQTTGAALGVRPLGGPSATAITAATAVDATALLDLRGWLASRFDWHPAQ
jgi:hypothetical protein